METRGRVTEEKTEEKEEEEEEYAGAPFPAASRARMVWTHLATVLLLSRPLPGGGPCKQLYQQLMRAAFPQVTAAAAVLPSAAAFS